MLCYIYSCYEGRNLRFYCDNKRSLYRAVINGLFPGEVWVSGAAGRRRMSPVPRLGLARLAGVTVLLASIATATAEDTELTTAATDQHTVSTD